MRPPSSAVTRLRPATDVDLNLEPTMSERVVDIQKHQHRYTLPFGAHALGNGQTSFRIWAPSRDEVELLIEGAAPVRMTSTGEGWFEAVAPGGPGTRYRFRFDDTLSVPDPASRYQPDDVHGSSMVIDPLGYSWVQRDWRGRHWTDTVLYELHVGAMGGYRGVQARLPELAALGITAIELMPLSDFPGRHNWGYDGVLPFAPDSAYGTVEELKALIDQAHGLGIQVFLDVVYNHFGPDGNYLHGYAASFFKDGTHTPWGPAIDFDRPEVSQFFIENALYWIHEYRIDGLRFDAVHAIRNPKWLRDMAEHIRRSVEIDRHVHLVLENEENLSSLLTCAPGHACHFDAQWNDDIHNTLHVMLTGETESYYDAYSQTPARKLARALGEGFVYQGEPSPIHDGKPRGEPSAALPPSAFVFFLQNHDQIGNRAMGPCWPITTRFVPRLPLCCSRPRSRCCLWTRSTAVRDLFCFSRITKGNSPTLSGKVVVASSRNSRRSLIRPVVRGFPTRMIRRPFVNLRSTCRPTPAQRRQDKATPAQTALLRVRLRL
jgi:maltooligosyltrehalose trehalohydrolase